MKSSIPLQAAIVGCIWAAKEYTYGTLDDGCRLLAEFSGSVRQPLPVVSFVHEGAACQLEWSDPDSLKSLYRDFISRFRPGPDLSFDPPFPLHGSGISPIREVEAARALHSGERTARSVEASLRGHHHAFRAS